MAANYKNPNDWPLQDTNIRKYEDLKDSRKQSIEQVFEKVCKKVGLDSLISVIESYTESGKPTGILDLGSQTGTLGSIFTLTELESIPPTRGIAVDLLDQRSDEIKEFDKANHINLITGDLTQEEVWERLMREEKFDVILSRMQGGLLYFKDYKFEKVIEHALDLLNDGGIMFLQTPNYPFQIEHMHEFIEMISHNGFDITYNKEGLENPTMIIRKKEDDLSKSDNLHHLRTTRSINTPS